MTTILQLNNSLFGDDGRSSNLANTFVEEWRVHHSDVRVIRRDLAKDPIPHLMSECFNAAMIPLEKRTPEQAQAAALADTLIRELMEADLLVIGSPTYNFNISSSLKAWFDHVVRAGMTFRYTANGPEGLLSGTKAYVFISSGGVSEGTETDFQTRYIQHLLRFLGVNDIGFTYLEGVAMGEDTLGKNMKLAQERIQDLVA